MNVLALLLNLAAVAAAVVILCRTEPALSRMGCATHWMIRYAMLLLAGGALAVIARVLAGAGVDFPTLLVLAGIALLLVCERRLRFLIKPTIGDRHAKG